MTLRARAVPVLMYHHVSTSPGMITVNPRCFDSQMSYLAKAGYRTIGSAQLSAFLRGEAVPPQSIVITFDDGYLDNWVHAHPVLQRHNFTALCFLVSSWPCDGGVRANAAGSDSRVLPRLLGHEACEHAIEAGRADEAVLRWSEIGAMREAGTFEFHSHTHAHIRWDQQTASSIEKRRRLSEDLRTSRETLITRLGNVSEHLCWPQGFYDDDYIEVALEAGFSHFYTCHPGTNSHSQEPLNAPLRSIKRIEVRDRQASWLAPRVWMHSRPMMSQAYLSIKR